MVYNITEIKMILEPILKTHAVKSAILFGSYSRNEADEKSDIDLMVDSGLQGLKFVGLVSDISEALQKPTDIFDVTQIKPNSDIESEIKQQGIKIYG